MQTDNKPTLNTHVAGQKRSALKIISYFLITLGLLIAVFLGGLYFFLMKPMMTEGKPLIVEVKANSTASALVQYLYNNGYIQSKPLIQNYIKYKGLANHLKAGVYQIQPGESAPNFIDRIVKGDVLTAAFRIIEGSNVYQVQQKLLQAPYLNYQSDDWATVIGNYSSAEGLLLADTYHYDAGSDAKRLLLHANKSLLAILNSNWETRSPGLPYKTPYELLIVASILEKETSLPSERRIVGGIVVNRLKKRMPLQMDPTVIYGLGPSFSGKLGHHNLDYDSPYNTYRYRGLPPTPIAMVGRDAIDAAAHPKFSDYLYFVAKGDGTHIFSKTYEEQKKAIARYMNKEHE
ncbi:putative periplasmic solute-binding protein [Legionella beliardensis]|uniref:Endolytic murein transglycosylase n=1 Tax=Legionella beliardensis TaxID=91822 RepID=A0A378I9A4_9GAMM|nr:endolytic transglycosylase MltG [Legionella beliardensis]STX28964.1 putative periplasmic solute-binding protein [Legionella beliardensis]